MQPDAEPTVRGYSGGQRVFGRYTLEKILGRGGMGVVWRARDETLGEAVALKFLPDAVRWDPGAFDDLKAETRRARQLTHPNIVRIHDFVEDASAAAISMELVDGRTLTQLRLGKENKILEPADIGPWLPQLCAALDYAHTQARVVHRDLKPSNLMLTHDGVLKVADFGVARSLADSITRVSMMSAGTLVYMSPQQAMGEEPSPADDIYAVGATLYELLTGKPPFHTGDVRVQLFQRKPDRMSARRRKLGIVGGAEIPVEWEETIAACIAKDSGERPVSAGDVARRLSVADRVRRWKRFRRPTRREGLLALVAIALLGWNALSPTRLSEVKISPPTTQGFPSDATRALLAWNFDADGLDASGRGLHATGVSSAEPTLDRHGRIDRALRFHGSAAVESAGSPLLNWAGNEPFTISIWLQPDALRAQGNHIMGNIPTQVGDHQWHLSLLERGHPRFHVGRLQEEGAVYADGATPLRAGEWAHVAGVSDGRTITVFLNGVAIGESVLTPRAIGRRPESAVLRLGTASVYAQWAYSGAMDELRIWRRALGRQEIAALASPEAPPRLMMTGGNYSEKDDLPAAIAREFGADAALADWDEIARWYAHDVGTFCDEIGLLTAEGSCLVQRAGKRIWEEPRHYMIGRWNGTKPAYYLAHEELGGFTLALGSWYGLQMRALARLPFATPRSESLSAGADGTVEWKAPQGGRALALAVSWRATLSRGSPPVRCELRLHDGGTLVATLAPMSGDKLALQLGDAKEPAVSRQFAAGWGDYRITVVARDGMIRFRAINAMGGALLVQEEVRLPTLRTGDIGELVLAGVSRADLIVE